MSIPESNPSTLREGRELRVDVVGHRDRQDELVGLDGLDAGPVGRRLFWPLPTGRGPVAVERALAGPLLPGALTT